MTIPRCIARNPSELQHARLISSTVHNTVIRSPTLYRHCEARSNHKTLPDEIASQITFKQSILSFLLLAMTQPGWMLATQHSIVIARAEALLVFRRYTLGSQHLIHSLFQTFIICISLSYLIKLCFCNLNKYRRKT